MKTVEERLPRGIVTSLKIFGWKFDDYAMELEHKGFFICIEFCIGDFCIGIYSKKGKWLLEDKKRKTDFMEAYTEAIQYTIQIQEGKHWKGEND